MRRRDTVKTVSNNNSSSDELLPNYVDTKKSSPEWLPKLAASFVEFDPHDFNLNLIQEEFRTRIAGDRARDRKSNAPSPDPAMDEKSYESRGDADKE
jgi:hypothetical protein